MFDPAAETFGSHQSIALQDFFSLPAGGAEIDIEGLAVHENHLWITGSHSLKRSKLAVDGDLGDLATLKWDANRSFLGRLPLREVQKGVFQPCPVEAWDASSRPRMIKVGPNGEKGLRWLLRDCKLFRPFMPVPAKENGFDVEGLALVGDRIVVGLRGPVLGRHAFLVSMQLKETGKHFLKPKRVNGSRYQLHAIDLGGFGIRDLLVCGDELLVLAGPTQAIEGLARIYAIRDFSPDNAVIAKHQLRKVATLPMREECDHAEGIALLATGQGQQLVVAHDSPAPERLDEQAHELLLDIVPLV